MDPSCFPDLHQHHHRRNIPPPPPHHHHPPPPQHHHFFEPRLPPPPPLSSSYHHPLPPPPPYNPHQSQFTFRSPSLNPQFLDHFSDCRDVCWDSSLRVFPENNRLIRACPDTESGHNQLIRAYPDSDSGHNQLIRAYPEAESGHNQLIKAYPEAELGQESGYFAFDRKPASSYPVSDQFMHDSEGSSRFRDRISDGFVSKRNEECSWDSANGGDYGRDSHFVSNRDKDSGYGNFEVSDSKYLSRREVDENLGFKSLYGSNFDNELFRFERKDGVSVKERLGSSRQPMRNLLNSSFNIGNDGFRDDDDDEAPVFSGKRVTSFDRKGSRDRSQVYGRNPRKQIQKKSALLRIQMGKPKHRNKSDAQVQSFRHYDVSNSSSFRGKGPIISSNFRNKEEEREREGSPVELDVSFKSNLLVAKPVVTPPRPTIGFGKSWTPNSNRKLTDSDTDNSSAPKVKFGEDRLKSEIFTQFCSSPSNSGQDVIRSDKKCTVSNVGKLSDACSKTLFNGTNGPVSAEEGNKVKKKKVVKKAMICYSSSLDETMKASSSFTHDPTASSSYDKGLTQPIENITSAGEVSGCSADLQPSPKKVSMKLGSNKIEIGTVQLHAVSNSDCSQIEFQGDKNVHEIVTEEDISNRPSKNGIRVALQYNAVRVYPQATGLGYNLNNSLSGSVGSRTYEAPVNSHSPGPVSNLGTDNAFVSCHENVFGVVNVDNDTSLPFLNQVTESHEHGLLGVSKIINMENPLDADTANHGAGTGLSSDYGLFNLQKKVGFSNIVSDSSDNFWKQPCPDVVNTSLENGSKEGSTTATFIYVDSGKEFFTNKIQERGHRSPQSNPLTLNQSDVCVGTFSEVGSGDCLDINISLNLSMEKFSDLQRKTSLKASSEEKISVGDGTNGSPIRFAHDSKKRRKLITGLSSSTVSNIEELPATVDDCASGAELRLNFNPSSTGTGEIALFDMDIRCIGGLTNDHVGKSVLHENSTTRGSLEDLDAVKDKIMDGDLNLEQLCMDSGSIIKDTAIMFSACPLGLENQQNENATSAIGITDQHNVNIVMKNIIEEANVHYTGKQFMISGETVHCSVPFELQSSDSNETFCSSNMECDNSFEVNDDIPSMPNCAALSPCGDGDSITNVTGEGMYMYDMPSNVGSPEPLSLMSGEPKLRPKLLIDQINNEILFGYEYGKKSDQEKSVINAGSEPVAEIDHLYTTKVVTLPAMNLKIKANCQNSPNIEANKMKKQLSYAVPKIVPGRSSVFFTNSGKTASSVQNTKPSTWCRTVNTDTRSQPLNQSFKKIEKGQTSYIRKGNSIVRNAPLASTLSQVAPLASTLPRGSLGLMTSVSRLKPSGVGELKKSTVSDVRIDMPGPSNSSGTRGVNAASQKAQLITLPHSPEHVVSGCRETTYPKLVEDTRSSVDAQKYIGISETKSGPVKRFDNQREYFDNSVSSNTSKIIYVKHKSNQLVASTGSCSISVKNAEKTRLSSSGGYYKRKKNQLIRTAHEHPVNERVEDPVDGSNSKCQKTHKAPFSRNFIKRWSYKESSLVWTLRGARSPKEVDNSMQHQRILPHLFPWKRACWKKFKPNSANMSSYSTSSVISKNLLLLRNRGAVYTRSSHGFSLRKSKVLSVGGRSLKWSVSIGKRSKKANEEATLAVAEVQRKKREANGPATDLHGAKIKKYSSSKSVLGIKLRPGERIYRIGSVRYKMDASKMTLQRISDDTSVSAVQQDKDVKKSYVPRRLVIGNDEYVRIGNGNQLIRDPKKRTRTLASEKVRWSLHTARQRLAKKWKYCQFFTRFGKCNKENGKCPYIHDLSKVAVCTKFLKGLCSNDNCKLTHKVIPERMQDCSYFMQGLCSNKGCPYRHVNVNPKSSTCEAFLRGYCAEGNECRKKHSYVCPVFEASGLCPEGSKCKLHHPKKRSSKKKKRRLVDQSSAGRYFGSPQMDVSEGGVVLDKYSTKNKDDLILADFISLEVSDEEIGENMDFTMSFDDGYSPDVEVDDDLDEMVKPVRLMNCSPS